ncbi:MAG: hypothetical protein H0X38_08780 [Planctomycetes bacterium]|nr:hypothetical protein [Planctomycetota bacterium]
MHLRSLVIGVLLGAASSLTCAEDLAPFGEFTLASGEKLVGVYHPDSGTFDVYAPTKRIQVTPGQILTQRRLAPEIEPEPASRGELEARVAFLTSAIVDLQAGMKRLENQGFDLERNQQARRLEQAKREEACKHAEALMGAEQDPARKAVYAALIQEHLKAIAEAHVAIAASGTSAETIRARLEAKEHERQDLQARQAWLVGRLPAFSKDK